MGNKQSPRLAYLLLAGSILTACGGSSSSSPVATPPTASLSAPGAPTIGVASAGDSRASITFTAPTSDGGSVITGYAITCSAESISATADGVSSPIDVTGLTNGTTYSCSVAAINSVGRSAASASVSVVPTAPPTTSPPSSSRKTYTTSELGWVAGENVSAQLDDFTENTLQAGDTLVIDAMYKISGSGYDLPEGVTLLGGLPEQAAGFTALDGVPDLAEANGLPVNYNRVFEVKGSNVRIENLYFTQDDNDTMALQSGGLKQGWFGIRDVDNFQFIGNKLDTKGWVFVNAGDSDNLYFEGNTFDSPKYGLLLSDGDNLQFINNFGTGGYQAPRIGGVGLNSFMDVIKTQRTSEGPTNPIITGNVFSDIIRDAIDTTGGFANANIYDNTFNTMFAGLDLKSIYDNSIGTAEGLTPNTNINISENAFFDVNNSIVTTTIFRDAEVPSLNYAVQDIHTANNTYIEGGNGFLIKNSKDIFSNNDYFAQVGTYRLIDAYSIGNANINVNETMSGAPSLADVSLENALQATGTDLDYLSIEDIQALNDWFQSTAREQRASYLSNQGISADFITDFTANDQIQHGTAENDTLSVGDGIDIIDMSEGNDTATFTTSDATLDVIKGFQAGDVIDVSQVVDANGASAEDASRFVAIVQNGRSTELRLNPDGEGTDFTPIAIFQDPPSRTVAQMVADGSLVF